MSTVTEQQERTARSISIRTARVEDAAALRAIYAPYVEETAITFEYTVPTVAEFARRIETTVKKYPYLVLEREGEIVGYGYAGQFHAREAYDWAVETSIYLRQDCRRSGLGRTLYLRLEEVLGAMGIRNLNACIAYTSGQDDHLTNDSVAFHEKLGYRLVGQFRQCGYKFDTWYDMVWMEKFIGDHPVPVQPVTWFSQLPCS